MRFVTINYTHCSFTQFNFRIAHGSPHRTSLVVYTNAVARGVTPTFGQLCSRVDRPGCIITINNYTVSKKPFGSSCYIIHNVNRVIPISICIPNYPPHPRTVLCNVVRLRQGVGVRGCLNNIGHGRPVPGPVIVHSVPRRIISRLGQRGSGTVALTGRAVSGVVEWDLSEWSEWCSGMGLIRAGLGGVGLGGVMCALKRFDTTVSSLHCRGRCSCLVAVINRSFNSRNVNYVCLLRGAVARRHYSIGTVTSGASRCLPSIYDL